jgi:outer membrane protein assembly factor BamB
MLAALAGAAVASGAVWTTYHHDAARSGVDPDSTSPLTPSRAWQSALLDGPIWGEPLVYGSDVYTATENDTVYALNAASGAIVWHTHLATPVPSGSLPCGDIGPTVGITSTPVIDPSTGRIYVVADTWDGSSAAHELYGLNLSDGSVGVGPVGVDPRGSVPLDQLQRAGLALDAGKVIIGYGGNDGDCGTYHGWLVAVSEAGGSLQTFEVDASGSQGAIWGAGNAPAIDSAGDIWVSTGNGNSSSIDYQEAVIKLDSNLNVLDWWAPTNWKTLDNNDTDLGSTMPLLLANTGLVFEIGKQGIGYLLSASHLGSAVGTPVYQAQACSGSWGGGIYVNGVVYVACADGMHALALNTANATFAPLSGSSVNSNAVGPPIFAGGLVWAAGATATHQDALLSALNPQTGATAFSANLHGFEHFATPSAGDGLLFVANQMGSGGDQITAFRIANTPAGSPPPGPPPPGPGAPPKPTLPAPTISHLHVHVVHGKLRLSLTLSEPAELTLVVSRLVPGRKVGGRCRVHARHGRRCQVSVRKLTVHIAARRGSDTPRPRMQALAPGRYTVTVVATNSVGERSRTHTAEVTVRRRG